ncbi:MAG: biotin--[acetyl-CoA-carboxylase] ligase [Myxococcales bacterium]|nr:biotin--[acetyl-CoA-carboxylase] ligase [Myxococcales bacterium]
MLVHLEVVPTATSTNDLALERARDGAPSGTIVMAEEQTQGRGRLGRRWTHRRGDLVMSLLLDTRGFAPNALSSLTLVAGVAVARVVRGLGPRAELKWPNDVLVGGKKLAGILVESYLNRCQVTACVVGVGLNVVAQHQSDLAPEVADQATSLGILGVQIEAQELASRVGSAIVNASLRAERGELPELLAEWTSLSTTVGKEIEYLAEPQSGQVEPQRVRCFAERIGPDGALVVRLSNGDERVIRSGEVSLVSGRPLSGD